MNNYASLNGMLHVLKFYGFKQSSTNPHEFVKDDIKFRVKSQVVDQPDQHMEYDLPIIIRLEDCTSLIRYQYISTQENGKLAVFSFSYRFDTTENDLIEALTSCMRQMCFPASYDLEYTPDGYNAKALIDLAENNIAWLKMAR